MFDAPAGHFYFPGNISTETFSSRLSIFVVFLLTELFTNLYRLHQLDRVRPRLFYAWLALKLIFALLQGVDIHFNFTVYKQKKNAKLLYSFIVIP